VRALRGRMINCDHRNFPVVERLTMVQASRHASPPRVGVRSFRRCYGFRKLGSARTADAIESEAGDHQRRRLRRLSIVLLFAPATVTAVGQHRPPFCWNVGLILPAPMDRIYQPGYPCKVFFAIILVKTIFMSHTLEEKKKLLNRVRRITGQVAAIEKALDREEAECSEILHNISACRGAMDALMAEVIEGHIRFHILPKNGNVTDEQLSAADDLVSALRAYLK